MIFKYMFDSPQVPRKEKIALLGNLSREVQSNNPEDPSISGLAHSYLKLCESQITELLENNQEAVAEVLFDIYSYCTHNLISAKHFSDEKDGHHQFVGLLIRKNITSLTFIKAIVSLLCYLSCREMKKDQPDTLVSFYFLILSPFSTNSR